MTTYSFKYAANRIHIESDIKINLTIQSTDNAEGSHSFNCVYPEKGIAFQESMENGTIHIMLTKLKSLLLLDKKEWDLTLNLAAAPDIDELKLDVANANLNFVGGCVNHYICNMANGTAIMDKEFKFKHCCINGANAELSITAPTCFENLEINLASGQTTLCFPASEHIAYTKNSLFTSFSQSIGSKATENRPRKFVVLNGAMISSWISTY